MVFHSHDHPTYLFLNSICSVLLLQMFIKYLLCACSRKDLDDAYDMMHIFSYMNINHLLSLMISSSYE